jgi:hypothetical protein
MAGEVTVLGHASDVELFDDHCAVAISVGGRQLVQNVGTLAPHLAVEAHDANLGLLSVFRSFLTAGDGPLGSGETRERSVENCRIWNETAVGIGKQIGNATIYGDDGLVAMCRISDVDFADNRSEPLVAVATNSAGFGFAFERSVHDDAEVAELGEVESSFIEMKSFWMRFCQTDKIAPFVLPSRGAPEFFEAALPRLVEFDEELRAHVAGNICQPRQFGAECRQIVDLIESCREASLVARASEAHAALLICEIPEKAQAGLPLCKSSRLLGSWVNAELVSLADEHVALSACPFARATHPGRVAATRGALRLYHIEASSQGAWLV